MSEKFYDNVIAPALLEISRQCKEANIPFLALVEYAPNEVGRTEFPSDHAGMEMQVAQMAARCRGNVDALFIGIRKYADNHGHSSVFLKMMEPLT